jgi:hypothetical protein
MREVLSIDIGRFNSSGIIDDRVALVPISDRGALQTALKCPYSEDGPANLPRSRLLRSEPYWEPAERLIIRWLYTRTNGSLRSSYGVCALRAARTSIHRCQDCGFADVRVLNLDHVDGRIAERRSPACALTAIRSNRERKIGPVIAQRGL